jgi:hypothetical protein
MTTLLNYIIDDFKPRLESEISSFLIAEHQAAESSKADNPDISYTNNLYVDFEFSLEHSETYTIETGDTLTRDIIAIESQVLFETDNHDENQATICILYGISKKPTRNTKPQDIGMDFDLSSEINNIPKDDFTNHIDDLQELISTLLDRLKTDLSNLRSRSKT